MADSVQAACSAPVFKRPRLDFSPNRTIADVSFDSLESAEMFHEKSYGKNTRHDDPLITDSHLDINGGDSGFHETSSNCTDVNSSSIDVRQQNLVYEQYTEMETTGSNMNVHGPSYSNLQQPPHDKDLDDNDGEDVASTISDLSALSDLSSLSGQEGKPAGPISWVQRQMDNGTDPRLILMDLLPKGTIVPPNLNNGILWRIIVSMLSEPPRRSKLSHINTLDDLVHLLRTCKKVMVLTGAGVSVSCGIPDFRSKNGVYARLSKDYPDLPDPQAMFDIHYFRRDPRPFFKFAKEIYPGQFEPSPSHRFIRLIEKQGKLLRNYTQNIDTLEHAAGIEKVITCHGSFATATCTMCHYQVDSSFIKDDIFNQRIPYCPMCPSDFEEKGIMKPDIVFFGEGLSDEFHETMAKDKDDCDLLIVMGSSLKVRPVALIPSSLPSHVPQILINREPLRHLNFDIELLGDCDVVIGELCKRLEKDWNLKNDYEPLKEITSLPVHNRQSSSTSQETVEVNNNSGVSSSDNKNKSNDHWGHSVLMPSEEESNSCDCRGLSAIKLDDSQDSSSVDVGCSTSATADKEDESVENSYDIRSMWQPKFRESIASRLPEKTFLFVPPNRYIFQGAEIYGDGNLESTGCDDDDDSPYNCTSPSVSSDDDDSTVPENACNEDEVSQSQSDFSDTLMCVPKTGTASESITSDLDQTKEAGVHS